mmetsp:Transcript_6609/g.8119  ORF Transcript_6609/g.8119 Transcript_6609/m.8119 type:complete len:95 (-) Transcript_6609:265-549(-)
MAHPDPSANLHNPFPGVYEEVMGLCVEECPVDEMRLVVSKKDPRGNIRVPVELVVMERLLLPMVLKIEVGFREDVEEVLVLFRGRVGWMRLLTW